MSVPNTAFRVEYVDNAHQNASLYCASVEEAKQVAWGFIKSDVVIIRVDYKHEDLRDIYIIHRLPKLGWSHEERWSDFEHLGTYKRLD